MLAQNFKTPADLCISDPEFEALVKVLGMLERGELKHAQPTDLFPTEVAGLKFTGHFNMLRLSTRCEDCGTAACILGTARLVFGEELFPQWEHGKLPRSLHILFYPVPSRHNFRTIRPEDAAIALRSYLTFGDPNWDEIPRRT